MPYRIEPARCTNFDVSSRLEWLLPNGKGGYAMGTVAGVNTRRYHGLLVAATRPPVERVVLVRGIEAFVEVSGHRYGLSANQYPGVVHPQGYQYLTQCLVGESVVSDFQAGDAKVQRRLAIHPEKNATTVVFRNTGVKVVKLVLSPLVCHRSHHANFNESGAFPDGIEFRANETVVRSETPLHILHPGAQRIPVEGWFYRFEHLREVERGLNPRDDAFCPCELRYELHSGEEAVIVLSAEGPVPPQHPSDPVPNPADTLGLLREAAEKFIVVTENRTTLLAGYPWFADWGRDTMIALPGILLQTGRVAQARQVLSDYAGQMRDGLIPNRFVEEGDEAEYNTVDATLWFANAVHQTLEAEWNQGFAVRMMKALDDVLEHHRAGTRYGIALDPSDGLMRQGVPGSQLTWMDAKIGDWVVTPRHGKAVEICGLWINALRVMEHLANRLQRPSDAYRQLAERAEAHFDAKFWSETLGYYLDTAEPDDASLRPNQVIAMSLPFGPAKGDRARRALDVVARELLTPYGLRTLAQDDPHYHGRFDGPLRELDAAYHRGTVWPWLLGPFVTATVKLTGDRREAKRLLRSVREMLTEYGMGGLAEVYDGDPPHRPNGCPWQAWSVGELLRAMAQDTGEQP